VAEEAIELGEWSVDVDDMVAFGREWDQLEFHVDPVRAASGPYGGLIASGRQSFLIWMRLYVDAVLPGADGPVSPQLAEVRWLLPVRPGDRLRAAFRPLEAAEPGRGGAVPFQGELLNQKDELVMTLDGRGVPPG
jgi:acyl dehydratase